MQVLTPLTSPTTTFEINEKHKTSFEKIKNLLLNEPLFWNKIRVREDTVKYLWVDAASRSGCLRAVLAQRVNPFIARKKSPQNQLKLIGEYGWGLRRLDVAWICWYLYRFCRYRGWSRSQSRNLSGAGARARNFKNRQLWQPWLWEFDF